MHSAVLRFLADSNRRTRFCRPLTKPLIQGTVAINFFSKVRFLADSNRRTRFCRPLTKPLIQGTGRHFDIVFLKCDAKVLLFFKCAILCIKKISFNLYFVACLIIAILIVYPLKTAVCLVFQSIMCNIYFQCLFMLYFCR